MDQGINYCMLFPTCDVLHAACLSDGAFKVTARHIARPHPTARDLLSNASFASLANMFIHRFLTLHVQAFMWLE